MIRRIRSGSLGGCSFLLTFSTAVIAGHGSTSQTVVHFQGQTYSLAPAGQVATAYSPAKIAAAYNFSGMYARGIDGAGQTVALIETDGLRMGGLKRFDAAYGLPAPVIKEYYVGGKKFKTQTAGETQLDVEWLHALAPRARIQIYYLRNNQPASSGWRSMAAALLLAAGNHAKTISISLGACSASPGSELTAVAFSTLQARGISVFVASGDSGDHPGSVRDCGNRIGVGYPGSDPSVVAVGGTSLRLTGLGAIQTESAWNLSGGGVEIRFARPVWQLALTLPTDNHRWAPDVSFDGDPRTGVSMYFKGRWQQVGGTSVGAPAWAAAWALIRQSAQANGVTLTAAPALLYSIGNSTTYASAFHDITTGSNGEYSAGPGWDSVTGWGTPDVGALDAAAQALSSAP